MKNYIQPGDAIDVAAPVGGVVSGRGVMIGSLFGISSVTAAAAEMVSIDVEGVFSVAKLSTDVMAVGAKVNWNDTTKQLQNAAGDLAAVATVVEAAGNPSSVVKVKLTPV
jgi:predicted RecA/RadA family phage recombinase